MLGIIGRLRAVLVCEPWSEVLTFRRVLVLNGRVHVLATMLILPVQRLALLVSWPSRGNRLEPRRYLAGTCCHSKVAWIGSAKRHVHHVLSSANLLLLERCVLVYLFICG